MSIQRKNIFFFIVGSIMTMFMVFGQSCGEMTTPGQAIEKSTSTGSAEAGNGDYYTGISDELSKSVSSMSDSLYSQSFNQEDVITGTPSNDPNACVFLSGQTCSAGIKRADYDGCTIGSNGSILTGYSQLEYSNNQCTRDSDGDEVLKTYDLTSVNRFNQELLFSTEYHYDYRGNQIGGGIRFLNTSTGFVTEGLGSRAILTNVRDQVIYDHSRRSLVPREIIYIDNDTSEVALGTTEIIDNLNQWTAAYSVRNLQMSRTCCHPTAGQMGVRYTGAVQGQGVITYSSCGNASLIIGDRTIELELRSCDQ